MLSLAPTVPWWLYIVTWVVIVFSYYICILNIRQTRRANKRNDALHRDFMYASMLALETRKKLHEVDPTARVEISEDLHRWLQEKQLEAMVFGEEDK